MVSGVDRVQVGLGGLVGSVPALVGFNPAGSLVVVGLTNTLAEDGCGEATGGVVVGVARIDLAAGADLPAMVRAGVAGLVTRGVSRVVVMLYPQPTTCDRGDAARVADVAATHAGRAGVPVLASCLVAGGRWWPMEDLTGPGQPVGSSALPAARVAPSRAHLVDQVQAGPEADSVARYAAVLGEVAAGECLSGWAALLGWGTRMPATGAARIEAAAVALAGVTGPARIPVRDGLALWLQDGHNAAGGLNPQVVSVLEATMPTAGHPRGSLAERVSQLARLFPDSATDAVAICAMVAWSCGSSVIAGALTERVTTTDPRHRLGMLLGQAIATGIPAPAPFWTL